MIKRDVLGAGKGSFMGPVWFLITPLFMFFVYNIVFTKIFQLRLANLGLPSGNKSHVYFFLGLIVYHLFSSVLLKSSNLIPSHVNYVKKMIFPLQILPIVAVGSCLFNFLCSFFVFLVAGALFGAITWQVIFIPLILVPYVFLLLGVSWFLSSVGAYLKDIQYAVTLLAFVIMFFSPVFYSIDMIPEQYRIFIKINPLSYFITECRRVAVLGKYPEFTKLAVSYFFSMMFAWLNFSWFQKARFTFVDVV